jgi:hypothetical protein
MPAGTVVCAPEEGRKSRRATASATSPRAGGIRVTRQGYQIRSGIK